MSGIEVRKTAFWVELNYTRKREARRGGKRTIENPVYKRHVEPEHLHDGFVDE
jgi:hypothetical protein